MTDKKSDQKSADLAAEVVTEPIAAAGGDVDSRRREIKASLAVAETRGDTERVEQLQAELSALTSPDAGDEGNGKRSTRERAAAQRKAAASKAGDAAQTAAPSGRTAPEKDTVAQATGDPTAGGHSAGAGQ